MAEEHVDVVVVLERGRVHPPGSFPRTPAEMHGMFDVWSFRGIDAVVSSGLGGGYENRPVTRADLDPHYDRVEAMGDTYGTSSQPAVRR